MEPISVNTLINKYDPEGGVYQLVSGKFELRKPPPLIRNPGQIRGGFLINSNFQNFQIFIFFKFQKKRSGKRRNVQKRLTKYRNSLSKPPPQKSPVF